MLSARVHGAQHRPPPRSENSGEKSCREGTGVGATGGVLGQGHWGESPEGDTGRALTQPHSPAALNSHFPHRLFSPSVLWESTKATGQPHPLSRP